MLESAQRTQQSKGGAEPLRRLGCRRRSDSETVFAGEGGLRRDGCL